MEVNSVNSVNLDHLTKYEIARLLGCRALQISMNAPAMVPLEPHETDPLIIAQKELKYGTIPLSVIRYYPDGTKVVVPVVLP